MLWAYAIMEYTGVREYGDQVTGTDEDGNDIIENVELAPSYYTGYQVTEYFLCLGSYAYCREEMLTYYGEKWNHGPMTARDIGVTTDSGSLMYMGTGGMPYDWTEDLVFNLRVEP